MKQRIQESLDNFIALNEAQPFESGSKFSGPKDGKIELKIQDHAPGFFTVELGGYDKHKVDLNHLTIEQRDSIYIVFTLGDKRSRDLKGSQVSFLKSDNTWSAPPPSNPYGRSKHDLPNTDFFFRSIYTDADREAIKTALDKDFKFWLEYLKGK
jgi:hypothetical protein